MPYLRQFVLQTWHPLLSVPPEWRTEVLFGSCGAVDLVFAVAEVEPNATAATIINPPTNVFMTSPPHWTGVFESIEFDKSH